MIWLIVFLSFVAGYTATNALYFLDAALRDLNKPGPITPNLPDDEQEWREMLKIKPKF